MSRRISVKSELQPHSKRRGSCNQARRGSQPKDRFTAKEKVERAPYALLLDMFEGAEWVIFKEKFCDWPDDSRIIKMKRVDVRNEPKVSSKCFFKDTSHKWLISSIRKHILDRLQ